MQLLTITQEDALFEFVDAEADIWIGPPLSFFAGNEIVPFVFTTHRYVMMCENPMTALGGEASFLEHSEHFTGGFHVRPESRILKFFRTSATSLEEAFDPELWELTSPRYAFQFFDLLREVLETHFAFAPEVTQYFYAAASRQLHKCYTRVYKKLPAESCLNDFEHVAAQLGNYHGFERKKIRKDVEPEDLAVKAS